MNKVAITGFLTILYSMMWGQQVSLLWEKSVGGIMSEGCFFITSSTQRTHFAGGSSDSNEGGGISGHHGKSDCLIVRVDSAKQVTRWLRPYGGSGQDFCNTGLATFNGGCVFAGSSNSSDGDLSANYGGYDGWVVALDSAGTIIWQKNYGGSGSDQIKSILRTADGGFVAAGSTSSVDGDVTTPIKGSSDFWILKISSGGVVQWSKTYGTGGGDMATAIRELSSGGFIVCGVIGAGDGDASAFKGMADVWIIRLDSSGNLVWQRSFGGTSIDVSSAVLQCEDGGFAVSGTTHSIDQDITSQHGLGDIWLLKLGADGSLKWQKCIGGNKLDVSYAMVASKNKSFVIAGETLSPFSGDVSGAYGESDFWIIEVDSLGVRQWDKCFGGSGYEGAFAMSAETDGAFLLGGYTDSPPGSGDVSMTAGMADFWMAKIGQKKISGIDEEDDFKNMRLFPNPATEFISVEGIPVNSRFEIFNQLGETIAVFASSSPEMRINLRGLSPGLYFYRVSGNTVFSGKFLKE